MAKKATEKKLESEARPAAKPRKRTPSATAKSTETTPQTATRHRKATKRSVEPQWPTEAEIAELAYLIYQARCNGTPEGDWAVAEAYLNSKI